MDDLEPESGGALPDAPGSGSLLLFFVKFLVLVAVLFWAWMEYGMPAYAGLVATYLPHVFETLFGQEGIYGRVILDSKDLLNTNTVLAWFPPGLPEDKLPPFMYFGTLVTNVPPYAALVLATAGLTLWRRIWVLAAGLLILALTHLVYIVVAFEYRDVLVTVTDEGVVVSKIAEAVEIFFLTLPFLLWIVLAYWEKLGDYFAGLQGAAGAGTADFRLEGAQLLPPDDTAGRKEQ